jgi:hypothetical protein
MITSAFGAGIFTEEFSAPGPFDAYGAACEPGSCFAKSKIFCPRNYDSTLIGLVLSKERIKHFVISHGLSGLL